MFGQDGKVDLAILQVKHRVGDIALLKHVLILMEFQYLPSRANFGEKVFLIESVLSRRHLNPSFLDDVDFARAIPVINPICHLEFPICWSILLTHGNLNPVSGRTIRGSDRETIGAQ